MFKNIANRFFPRRRFLRPVNIIEVSMTNGTKNTSTTVLFDRTITVGEAITRIADSRLDKTLHLIEYKVIS